MACDYTLADRIIGHLNDLVRLDRAAVMKLVEARVPCNDALTNYPNVVVYLKEGEPAVVGMLGVLSGLCGMMGEEAGKYEGWGVIVAVFDDVTGEFTHFGRTDVVLGEDDGSNKQ